ncbi:HNH endonuclease, partial [Arthrobacter sp. KK5.5]
EAPGWSVIPVPGIRHTVQTTTPTGHTYTSTAPALPGTPAPGQPSGELIEYRGQRRRTRLLQHLKPRKTA